MGGRDQKSWDEAQRLCKLSDDEVRMARELGFQPDALIRNRPSPAQRWKAPVNVWVRELYQRKFGSRPESAPVFDSRTPLDFWPDNPEIPELIIVEDESESDWDQFGFPRNFDPPSDDDINEQNSRMLRRQCLFRWAAQLVAVAWSQLPEVQKVQAFGSVACRLESEVPRFREYRRHQIEVLHECRDLDLAVWLTGLTELKKLKKAMSLGLSIVQETEYGSVAHHKVDVHVFDAESGTYRGRLCAFGQCPKQGKEQCRVRNCGEQPFLQQLQGLRWNQGRFEGEPRVSLFDRAAGHRVGLPVLDAKPAKFIYRRIEDDEDEESSPF